MQIKITGLKNMKSGKSRVEMSGSATGAGEIVDFVITATGPNMESITDALGIDIEYDKNATMVVSDAEA